MLASPQPPIRVMLVDDHRTVLWGLEKLIDGEMPKMQVVGKATSCAAALALAAETLPDVAVLDLDLAGENGTEIIPRLTSGRRTRVLILTGMRDSKLHETSILRGACGLVLKHEPAATLLKAIEKVHQGELWLDRTTTGRMFIELSKPKREAAAERDKPKLESLTARERDVVRQVVLDPGADNCRLAERLQMGEHTLRNHLSRIYDKLGVPNRVELYVYAQRYGLSGGPLS
jgi:two-component system, NarL family, nitrate/nitrite response regulator NarL